MFLYSNLTMWQFKIKRKRTLNQVNGLKCSKNKNKREREDGKCMRSSAICGHGDGWVPECAQVGLMIVGKIAMSKEMSNLVFIFYSNAFASLILLPSSFLIHRYTHSLSFSLKHPLELFLYIYEKSYLFIVFNLGRSQASQRPPLTFSILSGFFLLGLLGWVTYL